MPDRKYDPDSGFPDQKGERTVTRTAYRVTVPGGLPLALRFSEAAFDGSGRALTEEFVLDRLDRRGRRHSVERCVGITRHAIKRISLMSLPRRQPAEN